MTLSILTQWATRWGVPFEAIADLRQRLGAAADLSLPAGPPGSEAAVQTAARLAATRGGWRLWRNNVGVAYTRDGEYACRYGLANDTPAVNLKTKSSDLIGINPVVITPMHVGSTIGQFVSWECKRPGWRYTGTGREPAQLRWLELVAAYGGDAKFIDRVDNTR